MIPEMMPEAFLKEAKVMRKCQHQYIAEIYFIASGPILMYDNSGLSL